MQRLLSRAITLSPSLRSLSQRTPSAVQISPFLAPAGLPGYDTAGLSADALEERQLQSFKTFNAHHGKFRVAILNRCNFNCAFCHNEGMKNPRILGEPGIKFKGEEIIGDDVILSIMNAYAKLGGKQLNITGGEPLMHKNFAGLVSAIEKQSTRIVLNSNVMLADRLLNIPKLNNIDAIYASLHSTREDHFKEVIGSGGAQSVMNNMIALRKHGYDVQINFSLGNYNKVEFNSVVDFAVANNIHLKAIAIIRRDDDEKFYKDDIAFIDPQFIMKRLSKHNIRQIGTKNGFGGQSTIYEAVGGEGKPNTKIEIKNIAEGRLMTDFCRGCSFQDMCGEGMYAVRVGTDQLWKPCLLRKENFMPVATDGTVIDYRKQILMLIDWMVGNWDRAQFKSGSPK